MKKIKFILLFILGVGMLNSCLINNESDIDLNDSGLNLAAFDNTKINLVGLADGSEYEMQIKMKVVGPTVMDLTGDVTVVVERDESSTATEGTHYRIDNPSIVLTKANNYLGVIDIVLVTAGNTPPMDGTPEFDDYVAPVLVLKVASATGDAKVTNSGKMANITLNYTPPNPYAGDYNAHLIYRHPSYGTYPDNIYVEEDNDKTLAAITGRKCETWFATWDTDLCWITVNADNTITYVVDSTWPYDVALGDPFDASKVTHFDPATGVIYLYYHYYGTGGPRIFWEVFTPKFK